MRFRLAWTLLADSLTAPEYCSRMARANLGRNSSVMTWPCSSILPSSRVDTPIAFAASWKAPGRRSPSCPRSSSAWTVPLLTIWLKARSAPLVSSDDSCNAVDASATAT